MVRSHVEGARARREGESLHGKIQCIMGDDQMGPPCIPPLPVDRMTDKDTRLRFRAVKIVAFWVNKPL